MKSIKQIQIGMAALFFSCLPALINGQTLADRISECYRHLVDNQNLTMTIEVVARDADQYERVVDQSTFIYTNDPSGFYMNMMDVEVVQTDELTVKLDHERKTAVFIAMNQDKVAGTEALPSWLTGLGTLDQNYTIEVEKENSIESFLIKEEDKLIFKVRLEGNKIKEVIQYAPEKMEYEGAYIQVVMEMKYTYQKAKKHLHLTDIIYSEQPELKLKSKYKNYRVIDYRDRKFEN